MACNMYISVFTTYIRVFYLPKMGPERHSDISEKYHVNIRSYMIETQ